jgi:hypothetical protein
MGLMESSSSLQNTPSLNPDPSGYTPEAPAVSTRLIVSPLLFLDKFFSCFRLQISAKLAPYIRPRILHLTPPKERENTKFFLFLLLIPLIPFTQQFHSGLLYVPSPHSHIFFFLNFLFYIYFLFGFLLI